LLASHLVEEYLRQIETALDLQLYVMATIAGLTIPDICGALPTKNGIATGDRYAKWFEENVGPLGYSGVLSGKACYKLRSSLLHQGSAKQHPMSNTGRILLFEPSADGNVFHLISMQFGPEKCLVLSIKDFCLDLVNAARDWWLANQNDSRVKHNYDKFARSWPNGIPPYIIGTPLIGR
jgi:hypothetical protein